MTQRAADDYVSIKRALEQIEREKAAALESNPEYDGQKTLPIGNDDIGGKSVDEYLGMMGWTDALGWHRLPPLQTEPVVFWLPAGASKALAFHADKEEWRAVEEPQQIRYLPWLGYDSYIT